MIFELLSDYITAFAVLKKSNFDKIEFDFLDGQYFNYFVRSYTLKIKREARISLLDENAGAELLKADYLALMAILNVYVK